MARGKNGARKPSLINANSEDLLNGDGFALARAGVDGGETERAPEPGPGVIWDVSPPATLTGGANTQNFDTLVNTGGGTNANVPAGWGFVEGPGNSTYSPGTGSNNAGDTYSFGAAASTERAFGTLQSGSVTSTIGGAFTNNTGGTITSFLISYFGEMWRLGTTGDGLFDRLDFQYSLDATSLTSGTWTDVNALDFTTPNNTGTLGARDGNNASFRTSISSTITSLSIANDATFWIRWTDFNKTNSDDGLAVDDFSITPTLANQEPTLTATGTNPTYT